MSSMPYDEPLDLSVRPSRFAGFLLCLMHMLALLVCAPLPISFEYRVGLLLAIMFAFIWNMYVFMQRTPRVLYWSKEEGWIITDRRGKQHPVQPLPEAYLGSWLVVAYFKDEQGKKRTVMVGQDSVRPEGFRRLKVLLRYGTPKS